MKHKSFRMFFRLGDSDLFILLDAVANGVSGGHSGFVCFVSGRTDGPIVSKRQRTRWSGTRATQLQQLGPMSTSWTLGACLKVMLYHLQKYSSMC